MLLWFLILWAGGICFSFAFSETKLRWKWSGLILVNVIFYFSLVYFNQSLGPQHLLSLLENPYIRLALGVFVLVEIGINIWYSKDGRHKFLAFAAFNCFFILLAGLFGMLYFKPLNFWWLLITLSVIINSSLFLVHLIPIRSFLKQTYDSCYRLSITCMALLVMILVLP